MTSIAHGVHQVPGYSRSFIIDGDEGVTLIDTGLPKRDGAIVEVLSSIGRSVEDVRRIGITHAHVDHFGNAAVLQQRSGAPVFAPERDAAAIRGEEKTPHPPVLDRLPFLKPVFGLLPGADPVEVDAVIAEGEQNGLPGDLKVIDTPGHTPGHISFLLERAGGVLFVGDAAVATKSGEVKRGWMNRSTPSFDASLRHIAEFDFEIAVFGHTNPLERSAADAFRRLAEKLG
jgi:glyoxylase-like metal-dependent hydrolase (beta-lactamase superfamily II)